MGERLSPAHNQSAGKTCWSSCISSTSGPHYDSSTTVNLPSSPRVGSIRTQTHSPPLPLQTRCNLGAAAVLPTHKPSPSTMMQKQFTIVIHRGEDPDAVRLYPTPLATDAEMQDRLLTMLAKFDIIAGHTYTWRASII